MDKERIKELNKLQGIVNIRFKDLALLDKALTHKSYANEKHRQGVAHNERLEFFGDAVLKLVISENIMHTFPSRNEGDLTKIRASVVSDANLAKIAKKLNLGKFLKMSFNERKTGGVHRRSNLANCLEALFGAFYFDSGLRSSTRLVLFLLGSSIDESVTEDNTKDYKSWLQEIVQQEGWKLPEYKIIKEVGPDHKKIFIVQGKVNKGLKKAKSEGSGATKKEAEQKAAYTLIQEIKTRWNMGLK